MIATRIQNSQMRKFGTRRTMLMPSPARQGTIYAGNTLEVFMQAIHLKQSDFGVVIVRGDRLMGSQARHRAISSA